MSITVQGGAWFGGSSSAGGTRTPVYASNRLLGSNLGTGAYSNTVATQIHAGDILVQTTSSSYSSGSAAVIRPLTYADVTTNKYTSTSGGTGSGGTISGVYGVAVDNTTSNTIGQANAASVSPGGVIQMLPSELAGFPLDPVTQRSYVRVQRVGGGNIFKMYLDTTNGSGITAATLKSVCTGGTLGGLVLISASATYPVVQQSATVDWNALSGNLQILSILGYVSDDPVVQFLLNGGTIAQWTAPTTANPNPPAGPAVWVSFLSTYDQYTLPNYTT